MNLGPIEACLEEILGMVGSQQLILVGGAAILVKRGWLEQNNAQTLISTIPLARSTLDLDFLLKLDLFTQRTPGEEVRAMLDTLQFKPKERFWQFEKGDVTVDFLARAPINEKGVKVKELRVGAKPTIYLHGRWTPEAFAVELYPTAIEVAFDGVHGKKKLTAKVAHSYGLLNMKVRAAHDWLQRRLNGEESKPYSDKHTIDVYILTGSLTLAELGECRNMANSFEGLAIAQSIREEARALFSRPDSPGFIEAQRQAGSDLDHRVFWDGLREALGIIP